MLRVDPTQRLTVAEAAELSRRPVVDVQVKLPSAGRTVTLSVRTDSTVGAIKAQLQGMSDGWCGSESMRLIFAGRELADEQTMLAVAQDEDCMHVLLRLPDAAALRHAENDVVAATRAIAAAEAAAAESAVAMQAAVAQQQQLGEENQELRERNTQLEARIRQLERQQELQGQQQQQQVRKHAYIMIPDTALRNEMAWIRSQQHQPQFS